MDEPSHYNDYYTIAMAKILTLLPQLHRYMPLDWIVQRMLEHLCDLSGQGDVFLFLSPAKIAQVEALMPRNELFAGSGAYDGALALFRSQLPPPQRQIIRQVLAQATARCHNGVYYLPLLIPDSRIAAGVAGIRAAGARRQPAWQHILQVYLEQAALAVHNLILHTVANTQRDHMNRAYQQLQHSYIDTVEMIRQMVDLKDFYTRGHSDRVAYYAVLLARQVSTDKSFRERVKIAALLHDMGKIGIPEGILCKPHQLDEQEFAVIQRHPLLGADIIAYNPMFSELGPLICAHHERYDGHGYPHHLVGTDIPLEARIITIADAFDAMMSDRQYRRRLDLAQAEAELQRGKTLQFDPELVDVFLPLLGDYAHMEAELAWTLSARAQQPGAGRQAYRHYYR